MIGTKQTKKVISWFLTLAMLMTFMPSFTFTVLAADGDIASVTTADGIDYYTDLQEAVDAAEQATNSTLTLLDSIGKIVIEMADSYGDGWNNAAIAIYKNDEPVGRATIDSGSYGVFATEYDDTAEYRFEWITGGYDKECSYKIYVNGAQYTIDMEPVTTYNLWVGGEQFTSENLIIEDGNGGTATYDHATNTLTLSDFTYSGEGYGWNNEYNPNFTCGAVIYYGGSDTLMLELIGVSHITYQNDDFRNESYGIYSIGGIEVFGEGSLSATGYDYGVECSGDITVNSGSLTATSNGYGVACFGDLTVNGGSLAATGGNNNGVMCDDITVNSGSLTATGGNNNGVICDGDITVNGGSLTATGNNNGVMCIGDITVNGGEVVAQGNDAAFYNAPTIADTFTNAAVWYGDSESAANAAGPKDKADLADNYNQKYVKVECNHGGENAPYDNGICVCGYYEPAVQNGDVYEISNAGQLFWFAELVNNSVDESFNAILTDDIDLEEKEWTPIGNKSHAYSGHFNGNGHTVSGLLVAVESSTDKDTGLFGYIEDAGIRNLSVDGSVAYVSSGSASGVGLLVGWMTDSIVYNCYTSGSISESGYAAGAAGGLVGIAQHSVVINCGSEADVSATNGYQGGLVGYMTAGYDAPQCLLNSYFIGSVAGDDCVGGLVGYLADDAVNNYSSGTVISSEDASTLGVLFGRVSNSISGGETAPFEPVIEKNYYASGNPIGDTVIPDTTGYTQQYTSSEELLSELNANLGTVEEIIAGHRGYLKDSQWAELVELLDGDSVTASHWRLVDDKVVHCSGTDEDADYICDVCGKYLPTAFVVAEYNAETSTATVLIPKAGTYTLIFADYEGTELNNVDTVTFTVAEDKVGTIAVPSKIDITLGTDDKIMLWKDMTTLVPLCDAYIVK